MNNKQLSQIKDLIKNNKRDRFIIFNDNEPTLVVMSVDEYKKITNTNKKNSNVPESDFELMENINRTIAGWKANQDQDNLDDFSDNEDNQEVDLIESSNDDYNSDDNLSYYYDMDDED